jgi:hypothetical protein
LGVLGHLSAHEKGRGRRRYEVPDPEERRPQGGEPYLKTLAPIVALRPPAIYPEWVGLSPAHLG